MTVYVFKILFLSFFCDSLRIQNPALLIQDSKAIYQIMFPSVKSLKYGLQ